MAQPTDSNANLLQKHPPSTLRNGVFPAIRPSQGPASGYIKLTIKITLDCWGGKMAEGLVYGVEFMARLWQEVWTKLCNPDISVTKRVSWQQLEFSMFRWPQVAH